MLFLCLSVMLFILLHKTISISDLISFIDWLLGEIDISIGAT